MMRAREIAVALMACALVLVTGCESTEPGSLELVFQWPDGAPDFADPTLEEDQRYTLWGRLEEWPGWDGQGEPVNTGARLVSEGRSPDDANAYVTLGTTPPESLQFSGVPYDVPLVAVVTVRRGADPAGQIIYFGHSAPRALTPGQKTTLVVDLALQAGPGAPPETGVQPGGGGGAEPGEAGPESGHALWICEEPSEGEVLSEACEVKKVAGSTVGLRFRVRSADRVIVANDASFSVGKQEVKLKDLDPLGGDLYGWPGPWDLDAGKNQ
ncbi:MAG: hypothetical protein VX938_04240, partial [Myxococcota bacterium]|nr:hypothetical protein [Myxococcota bacterium]